MNRSREYVFDCDDFGRTNYSHHDYTGQKIGKWLLLERLDASLYKMQCECGFVVNKQVSHLQGSRQCISCYRKERRKNRPKICLMRSQGS